MATRKEKFNQVDIVKKALIRNGLIDEVTVCAYLMENFVGKRTLHIKCTWNETFKSHNPSDPYMEKTTEKVEELNGYFSGRVFAEGITQRKDWILATGKDRRAFLANNQYAHPAMYRSC